MQEMMSGDVLTDVVKALLLPLLVGLVSPLYRAFDVKTKRQEQLRRVEILKTLSELDGHFLEQDPGLAAMYRARYRELMAGARHLHPMWPHVPMEQARRARERRDFGLRDALFALLAPLVATGAGMIAIGIGDPAEAWGFPLLGAAAGLGSVALARFVILPRLRSGFWQGFAEFFAGFAMLAPAWGLVIALAALLGI